MGNVFNLAFRAISSLLGVLIIIIGVVWMAQGMGWASGRMAQSFMENNHIWVFWGGIAVLIGIGQVMWSNTRQEKAA